MSLQKEIVDKNKIIENQSKEFSLMDEKNRALLEANSDAVKTVDGLTNNLKSERARILDLENQLRESGNEKHRNLELVGIIKDLRSEKELYENEYNNLLNNQFSKDREKEFLNELEVLRNTNADLEHEIKQYIKEKSGLLNKMKELTESLVQAQHDKDFSDRRMIELQSRLEDLDAKLRNLTQDGEIDLNELEEALAIVRLRREKGIPLDFLIQVDELIDVLFKISLIFAGKEIAAGIKTTARGMFARIRKDAQIVDVAGSNQQGLQVRG